MLNKNDYQGNAGAKPYIFSDEATKRKVRRHISDKNDIITEKDIKNAKVPGVDESATNSSVEQKPNKKQKKKIDEAIAELRTQSRGRGQLLQGGGEMPTPFKRKRRTMSAEARRKISEGMKRRHAERAKQRLKK